jgi:hypothetical protein
VRDESTSGEPRIGEWVPALRSEPPVTPATPAWVRSEETVALPAFLRGLPAPGTVAATTDPTAPLSILAAPVSAQPFNGTGRHAAVDAGGPAVAYAPAVPETAAPTQPAPDPDDAGDRLPSSERNMLIFVSSLLAAGTLAIVAMGHSALDKHAGPPATITTAPVTATASGQSFVGTPDVPAYCEGLPGHLASRPPGTGRAEWSCAGTGYATVTFTPTDVCRAQFGPSTRGVYTTLTDPRSWRCLR